MFATDTCQSQGLYRSTLAGPGRSLSDAFANLDQSSRIERVLRHPKRDLLSARVTLTPEEGRGYWELTRIRNDLYIILGNFCYKDRRLEFVPGDGLVQFNFKLSGDLTYAIHRPGLLRFNRPALHLWRQPKGVDMHEWTAASSHERIVTISVRPEFLLDHCLSSSAEVPPLLRAFVSKPRDGVDFWESPLTAQMLDITGKLLDNPYTGELYLMYQEALTFELLCVAVGSFGSESDSRTEVYSERELRAFNAARQMLLRQFDPAPTLRDVARSVGLAERALTRGFREVYGETIFDFGIRSRMQHALTLLQDRHWSVDRVSEAVGYSHPTSFATAFRRHFGLRPIDVKRLKSRQS